MAKYSYNNLRDAAKRQERIGGYQSYDVRCCASQDYNPSKPGFYVIYDDGNKLVRAGYVYGSITSVGTVNEEDNPYKYVSTVERRKKEQAKRAAQEAMKSYSVPASGYSATVNGGEGPVNTEDFFVRLDKEINELLANASKADLSVNFV